MLDKLTKESFSPYVGTPFRIQLDPNSWVTAELLEVTGRGIPAARASWATPPEPMRESFSIVFRGPLDRPLLQRMYRVEHDAIGIIDDLFRLFEKGHAVHLRHSLVGDDERDGFILQFQFLDQFERFDGRVGRDDTVFLPVPVSHIALNGTEHLLVVVDYQYVWQLHSVTSLPAF